MEIKLETDVGLFSSGGGSHDSSLTNPQMICHDWESLLLSLALNISVLSNTAIIAFQANFSFKKQLWPEFLLPFVSYLQTHHVAYTSAAAYVICHRCMQSEE